MAETVEVAIIGGGIAAASLAYHLAVLGVRGVLVLETSAVASGASGRASGLLTFLAGCHPTQAALLGYSADFYRRWPDLVGGAAALTPVGALLLLAEAQRGPATREVALMQAAGHDTTLLERHELAALLPGWDLTGVDLAAYSPGSGYIDPPMATSALMNRARSLGVRVYQGARVTGIRIAAGQVAGVTSTRGEIRTKTVVIAAGAWSTVVGRLAGLPIPVEPAWHPVAHLVQPADLKEPIPCCSDPQHNIYFRPEPAGLLAVGAMQEEPAFPLPPAASVEGFDPAAAQWLGPWARQQLARRIPALARAEVAGGHAGVYAITPDRYPLLGPFEAVRGLYAIVDGAGNGMTSGPGLGRALAETIVQGKAWLDTSLYDPDRFGRGTTNRPAYHHTGAELAVALLDAHTVGA